MPDKVQKAGSYVMRYVSDYDVKDALDFEDCLMQLLGDLEALIEIARVGHKHLDNGEHENAQTIDNIFWQMTGNIMLAKESAQTWFSASRSKGEIKQN